MARGIDIKIDVISDPNGTAKVKRQIDDLEKDVIASAKRVEANKKATTRAIVQSDEAMTRSTVANAKASANAVINELRRTATAAKTTGSDVSKSLTSALSPLTLAGLAGGIAGGLVSAFTTGISQLPGILKNQLDEMTRIASERQNAARGLTSMANFLGISQKETQDAVKNLRLVRAGVVEIGDATVALKNLLASGFSLPESIKLMEAFSDTAAFGKAQALSFGEAIRGASEGIKNGNSILVDNVGLTKNLSQILKDAGFAEKDLMKVKDDMNVRQALFNGLIKEALPQLGDADKLTQGWTGSTAALTAAQNNLYAALGNVIIQNTDLIALIRTLTMDVNKLAGEVDKTGSTWNIVTNSMASGFTSVVRRIESDIRFVIAGIRELSNDFDRTLLRAQALATFAQTGVWTWSPAQEKRFGGEMRSYDEWRRNEEAAFNRNKVIALGMKPGVDPLGRGPRYDSTQFGGYKDTSGLGQRWMTDPKTGMFVRRPTVENAGGLPMPRLDTAGTSGRTRSGRISHEDFQLSPQGKALVEASERLGISPIDLATIISYETAGTFSPTIRGGKGNNYRGLIQFGPEEYARYKVGQNKTFESQLMNSVVPFLKDRFAGVGRSTYDASILDLYKTINGGNPNVSGNASDGNSTIAQHVRNMLRTHQPKALNRFFGGSRGNVPSGLPSDVARELAGGGISPFLTPGDTTIGTDLDLSKYEKQIDINNQLLGTYEELIRAVAGLNEMSQEEEFWLDVKLGKYKHLTEEEQKSVASTYAMIDATKAKRAADEQMTRQAEDFAREQQNLFEETRQGWEDLLNDLANGNFKSIWDRMRRSMLDMFIRPASAYLTQLFGGGMQPAMAGGFGGGGFNLGGLFGGGMAQGTGMGPGGTPMFNPGGGGTTGGILGNFFGGGGQSQGGIGSLFGGLFGRSGGGIGHEAVHGAGLGGGGFKDGIRGMGGGSLLAGSAGLGGMAAQLIGGAIGGKWGNFMQMAGMGTQIGAMFGPWGALIGGAIGAGAGLISMLFGRDNSEKKLKESALKLYGISVKDKSVLKSLKKLGETMFGKRVGENADAVVSSDEGQLILRNYAEATNQSSSKMDAMHIGDESWKGNQFRSRFGGFRAFGGPVRSGVSYIVGERGPELFTAKQSGQITPNGAMDPETARRFLVVLGQLEETNNLFATKLRAVSAADMVSLGAEQNPGAFGRGFRNDTETSLRAAERNHRGMGSY